MAFIGLLAIIISRPASAAAPGEETVWKPVPFAILRFNEDAPGSWNMYHAEKRGVLLIRLWKRYLLVDVKAQEVYDLDPGKIKQQGDNVEFSSSDKPGEPIDTSEWKTRDIGRMSRVRFRFGTQGHTLDIQIPLLPNGKTAY
ncbi:MAG TPA: hypothetical protein VGM92_03965 [Candidatus Kapabacteria bacterium]